MLDRISRIALFLSLALACAWGQDPAPSTLPPGPDADDAVVAPEPDVEADPAATGNGESRVVRKLDEEEKVRVLTPQEIPAELVRLKSKADIKAEISVRTSAGTPVVFKGVIRNGKLIERIVDRRFVPQVDINHNHCGVRVWWSGGSDGFIFFRYADIQTIAITGKLTDEERREILRRLKARREGREDVEAAADPHQEALKSLEQMTPAELQAHLVKTYPYDQGWDHKRLRDLRRKEMLENKVLTNEEAIFVKYFPILEEAHFEALKQSSRKIEIEPGSARPDDSAAPPAQPSGPAG